MRRESADHAVRRPLISLHRPRDDLGFKRLTATYIGRLTKIVAKHGGMPVIGFKIWKYDSADFGTGILALCRAQRRRGARLGVGVRPLSHEHARAGFETQQQRNAL